MHLLKILHRYHLYDKINLTYLKQFHPIIQVASKLIQVPYTGKNTLTSTRNILVTHLYQYWGPVPTWAEPGGGLRIPPENHQRLGFFLKMWYEPPSRSNRHMTTSHLDQNIGRFYHNSLCLQNMLVEPILISLNLI